MSSEKGILKELDCKYPKSLYWTIWQKPSPKSLKVSVKKKKKKRCFHIQELQGKKPNLQETQIHKVAQISLTPP